MSLSVLASINVVGWYSGDTAPILLTVTTAAGGAYDLAGCSVTATVYERLGSAVALFTRTSGDGINVVSTSGGTLTLNLSLSQSNSLVAGASYPLKVVLTNAAGSIITTSTGAFNVR